MAKQTSELSELDRKILRVLQMEANMPLDRVAEITGSSRTAVWNRIKKFEASGLIQRYSVILDAELAGLGETFYVTIRTNKHDTDWLQKFSDAISQLPEIIEAHRLAGENDYMLKVQVPTTRDYDGFYRRLIDRVEIYNVTSHLSMETLKSNAPLPV
jgi:Lrp/AsnC family transcriptional regulator